MSNQIDDLLRRIEELEQEKQDLENLLEMSTEHSDTVVEEAYLKQRHLEDQSEIERHRAISLMVAGVAHEINTPISIAHQGANMIEALLTDDFIEEFNDALPEYSEVLDDIIEASELILRNVTRADSLIKSFENVSVQQANEKQLEQVNIRTLINDTIALLPKKIKDNRLNLSVEFDLDDGAMWVGYPGYLTQIILNLINNALLHAYPDGNKGCLLIEVTDTVHQFHIKVQDQGVGMSEEVKRNVLIPFYTTKRGKGGAGLGMSIIHNMVTGALKGSLDISSKEGEGSCIMIKFPKKTPEAQSSSHHQSYEQSAIS